MQKRRRNARVGPLVVAGIVLLAVVVAAVYLSRRNDDPAEIRFAYQNHIGSAVCIVAVELNMFQQEGVAVAAADASIRSASDLPGKKLAVKKGTSTYGGLLAWLAASGIPPAEIRILDMSPTEMPDALAAGSIDGFAASEPTPSIAESRGAREVATLGGLGNRYPILLLAHTRSLQSRPDEVRAVLRALQRAVRFIEENPDRAARIVAQGTGLSEQIVQPAMQRHVYRLGLDEPIRQSLHKTALFLREQQLIQQLPDWGQACDNRFLPLQP